MRMRRKARGGNKEAVALETGTVGDGLYFERVVGVELGFGDGSVEHVGRSS